MTPPPLLLLALMLWLCRRDARLLCSALLTVLHERYVPTTRTAWEGGGGGRRGGPAASRVVIFSVARAPRLSSSNEPTDTHTHTHRNTRTFLLHNALGHTTFQHCSAFCCAVGTPEKRGV
uniref:Putative secreted protein n=1 Tax=Anopheles triannulatus TaxID=58253 RepID=A0A2M4B469_9DIPT